MATTYPVAGVFLGIAFVAALVVAGQPRHQFLLVPVTHVGHELVGATPISQQAGDRVVSEQVTITIDLQSVMPKFDVVGVVRAAFNHPVIATLRPLD